MHSYKFIVNFASHFQVSFSESGSLGNSSGSDVTSLSSQLPDTPNSMVPSPVETWEGLLVCSREIIRTAHITDAGNSTTITGQRYQTYRKTLALGTKGNVFPKIRQQVRGDTGSEMMESETLHSRPTLNEGPCSLEMDIRYSLWWLLYLWFLDIFFWKTLFKRLDFRRWDFFVVKFIGRLFASLNKIKLLLFIVTSIRKKINQHRKFVFIFVNVKCVNIMKMFNLYRKRRGGVLLNISIFSSRPLIII